MSKLTYNANGGVGGTAIDVEAPFTAVAASPESLGISRKGVDFLIWNTKADGLGVSYAPGDEISVTQNITLYAIWSRAETIVLPAGSTGDDLQAEINSDWLNAVIEISGDMTLSAPITIPAEKEITIRSAEGATRTLSMSEEAANYTKHFLYEASGGQTYGGVLILQDIVLKGVKKGPADAYTGGSGGVRMDANTYATLIMNSGAVIEDCFNSEQRNGGGVAIKQDSYGTLVMNDGATIQNCYSTVGNACGGVVLLTDAYATFIMNDGAVIKGCYGGSRPGGVIVGRTSEFTMNGGEISGNKGAIGGMGVYTGSIFTMNGGKISGNTATNATGGVSVAGTGTFTMNGGEISGNTATGSGGGVYISGAFIMGDPAGSVEAPVISGNTCTNTSGNGGGVYLNSGTFTMNRGEISGNAAQMGGGVYVKTNGKFTMNDSVISGNEAAANGGGVYTEDENYGNLTIGGNAVFSGNKGGTAYAPPADAAAAYQNIQFISTSIAAHPLNNYDIGYTGSTVYKSTLIYDANGGDGVDGAVIEEEIDAPFEATLLTAEAAGFSRQGYALTGWNTITDGTGTDYAPGAAISATHDITLYAQWYRTTDAQLPEISAHPQGATVKVNGSATLSVTAGVTDGGTLSYQWYSNTTDANSGGTEITGATDSTYVAPTSSAGTTYYYVVVTNNYDSTSGNKTTAAVSNVVAVVTLPAAGETAVAQGFNQTARLYDPATNKAHIDVTVLNTVETYDMANEGKQYFLNRVNEVYDVNEDVQLQVYFGAGMNNYSADGWKVNGMRYMTVLDAASGAVVANWRDESVGPDGRNSSGAYQIQYSLADSLAANVGGIRYTIPKEAFEPESSYFVVIGSATCGNNNSRMLYVPVIYLITTSDENGEGHFDTAISSMETNVITVNENKAAGDSSAVYFNRYSGSSYSAGSAIESSVTGQEICLIPTVADGLSTSIQVVDERGQAVPLNSYAGVGNNASSFGDSRFTMPNKAVDINITFGYETSFAVTDYESGAPVADAAITVQDAGDKVYPAESNGTYVLPAGEYSYTVSAAGYAAETGIFTAAVDNKAIDVKLRTPGEPEIGTLEVLPATIVQNHVSYINVKYDTILDGTEAYFALLDGNGNIIGDAVKGNNGKAVIAVTAPDAVGVYDVAALAGGSMLAKGSIEVVAYDPNIWTAYTTTDRNGYVVINFNEKISTTSSFSVTWNGQRVGGVVSGDSSIVTNVLSEDLDSDENVFVAKGIKYPRLYPSYSFTFTVKY